MTLRLASNNPHAKHERIKKAWINGSTLRQSGSPLFYRKMNVHSRDLFVEVPYVSDKGKLYVWCARLNPEKYLNLQDPKSLQHMLYSEQYKIVEEYVD